MLTNNLLSLPIVNKLNNSANNNSANKSTVPVMTPRSAALTATNNYHHQAPTRQRRAGVRRDEAPSLSPDLQSTSPTSSQIHNTKSLPVVASNSGEDILSSIVGSILGNVNLSEEENLDEEDVSNIIQIFKPLLDLILYDESCRLYFLLSFASIQNTATRETILTSLLQLLNEQSQNAASLFASFIDFDYNRPEHVKKLFSDSKPIDANDTPSQRMLKLFNRMYGNDYLFVIFEGITDSLVQQQQENIEDNSAILALTEKLVQNVQKSLDKVPAYLRHICKHIATKQEANSKQYHIANLLFRNFICPAIVLPEKFNVWHHETAPSTSQRQVLLAVSKLFLQLLPANQSNQKATKLSTTVLDGDTEFAMYTTKVTKFIEQNRPIIAEFCDKVATTTLFKSSSSNNATATIPLRYTIPELLRLHKHLSEHYSHFPILDPVDKYSETSHIRRASELTNLLKSAKSRDNYIQHAQKVGKLVVPISWVKHIQRPNENLHIVTNDYDSLLEKQLLKDLQRDSILINAKLFRNCSDITEIIQYMMQAFGSVANLSEREKAKAAIAILQKTGRTSGGGDSFDACYTVFGSNEAAIVTPDSFSMNDHPHTIQITRGGSTADSVKIETSQVNFYKITDAKTYHEEHSVWFKVKSTVKWSFRLSTIGDNSVDVGSVILEPDMSYADPEFKLLANSPVNFRNVTKADHYLSQLQRTLYQIEVKEKERIRNAKFKSILSKYK